jgi:hypothetical protein
MADDGLLRDANGWFVTDERGGLIRTPESQNAAKAKALELDRICAAAEHKLQSELAAGGYQLDSFNEYLTAKGIMSPADRIYVKRMIEKTGEPVERIVRRLQPSF